jgi:hypothetical protein
MCESFTHRFVSLYLRETKKIMKGGNERVLYYDMN